MRTEQALLPRLVVTRGNSLPLNIAVVMGGALLISLLAQIAIPLQPVPITGQTFGVALVSMLWGWKRGLATLILYISMGAAGLPVFAVGKSGLAGATSGYLAGMVLASFVMGSLADRGWTKTFLKAWIAGFLGSVCVFTCGLAVLSIYVPFDALLIAGLIPFLPGDLTKTLLAAFLATKANRLKI